MTGAGRSTAAKELEDLGCFVVDNLPPAAARRRGPPRRRDPRRRSSRSPSWSTSASGSFFAACSEVIAERLPTGRRTDAAVPRGHRRRAGAPPGGRPPAAPAAGRRPAARRHRTASASVLADLRGDADLVIDTTDAQRPPADATRSPHAFGDRATTGAAGHRASASASSTASRSTPTCVVDMRFLPNPHWVPELRPQTGRDAGGARLRARPAGRRRSSWTGYVAAARRRSPRATCGRASAT